MKETLKELDFVTAAQLLIVEVASIKAVCKVEAPKGGFFIDDRPAILYEPFTFGRLTKHIHDNTVIQIDNINYPLSLKGRWNRERAVYGPSTIQYYKLDAAKKLDEEAALKCCSWGKFQILGENYKEAGFDFVHAFVDAMQIGEKEHLTAFVKYIKSRKLDEALRVRDWKKFALKYNGPGYEQNQYDIKLEKAYREYLT